MRAIAIAPGCESPRIICRPAAEPAPEEILVEGLLVGICATDRDVVGRAGSLPGPLILGHESLGRVLSTPAEAEFAVGDLVVGLIRRPCPEACASCLSGNLDRCVTRPPVERGISRADGFASELWTCPPAYLCPVPSKLGEMGVLIEPASSVTKGLRRIREHGATGLEGRVLVFGAGTIGVLAVAAMVQQAAHVDVSDPYVGKDRGAILASLGARLLTEPPTPRSYSVVVEASGAQAALAQCFQVIGPNGHVLVLGIPQAGPVAISSSARLVMDNVSVTFSVSATPDDHRRAASMLCEIEPDILNRIVARELTFEQYSEALLPDTKAPKTVVRVTA